MPAFNHLDVVAAIRSIYADIDVAPRGADTIIRLAGRNMGQIRLTGDCRIACTGYVPSDIQLLLLDY